MVLEMDVGGWMNADMKNGALVCNFGTSSLLKSPCVYLFNIHLKPSTINTTTPKPFKNKDAVRKNKCAQLTVHSAFRLMGKYLLYLVCLP